MRIHISTASHVRIRIRYCKSHALRLNVQWGSYDKIITTIVPSYTGKKSLVCCRRHCYSCCALITIQTGNKVMIFSSIALYYGDNYTIQSKIFCYIQESIQGSVLSWRKWGNKHLYSFVGSHSFSHDLGVSWWHPQCWLSIIPQCVSKL